MASWKKVIVSGSQASLAGLSGSLLTDGKLVFSKGDEGALTSVSGVDANGSGHLDGIFSGSFSGSFEGDGGNLTNLSLDNSLTDGNGIADFTFDGSAAAVVSVDSGSLAGNGLTTDGTGFLVQADSTTGGNIQPVNITANGVGFDVDSIDGTGLTATAGVLNVGGLTPSEFNAANVVTSTEVISNSTTGSDDTFATTKAIKDYVDNQLGASGLDITDGTNTGTIDLDTQDLTFTSGGGITATVSGQTVTLGATVAELGGGLVSGSAQVIEHLPAGTVSGSAQVRSEISVSDTTGASGINMTYVESTGVISGVLQNSDITLGADTGADVAIGLGGNFDILGGTNIATSINGDGDITVDLDSRISLTDASGSFSGSFEGDGSGLTGLATNLQVSSSANNGVAAAVDSIDLKSEGLLFAGTENEVKVETAATAQGNTVTVGLPTNVTIQGDLTVLGTRTELNVEDLVVEDRFIYLASGSSGATDGGIIVEGAGDADGAGFGWDQSAGRWGFDNTMASGSDTISPSGYAAAVVTSDTAAYQKVGNIRIDTSTEDIYIYS